MKQGWKRHQVINRQKHLSLFVTSRLPKDNLVAEDPLACSQLHSRSPLSMFATLLVHHHTFSNPKRLSNSHIFWAGVPTSAEHLDAACFSIRVFRRAIACCNHKAGQWMCRTCPAPCRVANPFAAVLFVRSSACMLKPKSSISAASLSVLYFSS